jgi:hypothetical protein
MSSTSVLDGDALHVLHRPVRWYAVSAMRTISFVVASMGLSLACVGLPPPSPASEASSSTTGTDLVSTTTAGVDMLETRGESSSNATTISDTTGSETTVVVDPTMDDGESSSGPPPECVVPEDCSGNEVCENGHCAEACGGRWGSGSYDYCLTEFGDFDTTASCGAGHLCIYWGDPIEQAACALQGCTDACDCPPPATTGSATVACGQLSEVRSMNDCYLSCADGETCPDGMVCNPDGVCVTEVPEVPIYGNCGNLAPDCVAPGICVGFPGGESVCMTNGCTSVADCPMIVPPGGNLTPACSDVVPMLGGYECYVDCIGGVPCPDGMICINGTLCVWPD